MRENGKWRVLEIFPRDRITRTHFSTKDRIIRSYIYIYIFFLCEFSTYSTRKEVQSGLVSPSFPIPTYVYLEQCERTRTADTMSTIQRYKNGKIDSFLFNLLFQIYSLRDDKEKEKKRMIREIELFSRFQNFQDSMDEKKNEIRFLFLWITDKGKKLLFEKEKEEKEGRKEER